MKEFMKVDYDSNPIIFAVLSGFRNLLRRSPLFDINAKEVLKYLYWPETNQSLNENELLEQIEFAKKNFDVHEKYRKRHFYNFLGQKKEIEYRYNSIGYRGNEVNGDEKFIAIGCSQTFGYSLEEEFTWPYQLEKLIKSRVVNLGAPGDSAKGAIMKAMAYIDQFGKPEAIFACLPLLRSEKFSVPDKMVNKNSMLAGPFNSMHVKDSFPKISKAPHNYNEILPVEDYILDTISSINIFDQYCREAGIKLIWTGWESSYSSNRVKDILCDRFPGFFFDDYANNYLFHENSLKCHTEYLEHPLFDYAADKEIRSDGSVHAHKGIHWNIHMAEKCYSEYLNLLNPIENI